MKFIQAILLSLLTITAQAGEAEPQIHVNDAWARATFAMAPTAAVYMQLNNQGEADKLTGVTVPAKIAAEAQIHSMQMQGDMMRMQQLPSLGLPAGDQVSLQPGGLHIMLLGLKAPLTEGMQFPLTMRFANAGEITIPVKVQKQAKDNKHQGHHHH